MKTSIRLDESDLKAIILTYFVEKGMRLTENDISFDAIESRDYMDRTTGGHYVTATVEAKI